MSLIFYCLDTETNGTSGIHEITQICAVRVSDRLQFDAEIRCHYPERSHPEALRITGKTHDDLRCGREKEHVIRDFNAYVETDGSKPSARVCVAHNAPFDRRFLHALWNQYGQRFPMDLWIDTIPMFKKYAKKKGIIKPVAKLDAALDTVGIVKKAAGQHNAISDTRNLYFLWKKLIETEDYLPLVKQFSQGPDEIDLNPEEFE